MFNSTKKEELKIFLWGMMGVGKSTLGKTLGDTMQMSFIDLDEVFGKTMQQSIPDYFSTYGEISFRQKERDLLQQILIENGRYILATGGGTPCYFDNGEKMKQSGICFYLQLEENLLAERLFHAEQNRPILKHCQTRNDLLDELLQLMEYRRPFYEQAHHTVVLSGNFENDILHIKKKINEAILDWN